MALARFVLFQKILEMLLFFSSSGSNNSNNNNQERHPYQQKQGPFKPTSMFC